MLAGAGPGAQQRRVKREGRTGVFGVAPQRQHVGVAVDDAGGRRQQGRVAIQRRLQRAGGFAREQLHVVDAIGLGMRPDRLQFFGFLRRRRDDQLAAIAMRDAVVAAVSVERVLAADAHLRHQAAGAVVDAGMDHLAVARGGHGADALGGLQHDHFAARLGQPPRDRKPDHPRSDDDAINLVHVSFGSGNLARKSAAAALGYHRFVRRSARTTRWFASKYASNAVPLVKH